MKKYAVIARIGNYNNTSIECTVKDVELIAENDDVVTLNRDYSFRPTEYKANGKWYSYSVVKRSEARKILKQFDKLG